MAVISGGNALEKKLAEIAKGLSRGGTVAVGFLEGSTYPDGTSVPMVAAIENFGAPSRGIPPRPFFSNMVAKENAHWGNDLAAILAANNYDVALSLEQMGDEIAGELRQSIVDTNAPPLSQITLMLRKMKWEDPDLVVTGATVGEAARRVAAGESTSGVSTKPLVETGHMLNSIGVEVTMS